MWRAKTPCWSSWSHWKREQDTSSNVQNELFGMLFLSNTLATGWEKQTSCSAFCERSSPVKKWNQRGCCRKGCKRLHSPSWSHVLGSWKPLWRSSKASIKSPPEANSITTLGKWGLMLMRFILGRFPWSCLGCGPTLFQNRATWTVYSPPQTEQLAKSTYREHFKESIAVWTKSG